MNAIRCESQGEADRIFEGLSHMLDTHYDVVDIRSLGEVHENGVVYNGVPEDWEQSRREPSYICADGWENLLINERPARIRQTENGWFGQFINSTNAFAGETREALIECMRENIGNA